MKGIIRRIREYMGLTQQEFADQMRVSFATVNRWENGHAEPTNSVQDYLFEWCSRNQIPVVAFIKEKIEKAANELSVPDNRILLYHGSKGGLNGEIAPISRERCDFGKGFYMGTMPEQPLTLICDFPKSKFYLVSVKLDSVNCIEVSADIQWAMLVAYYRGRMESIKGTAFYRKYESFANGRDVIIGSIANDKMFQVLDEFFIGNITDMALTKSLAALELGKQYVAVTKRGCEAIKVEREIPISRLEKKCFQALSEANRAKGVSLANEICRENRRNGKFFDEIIEEARG